MAYEMRISDWSSDVCSSDLVPQDRGARWPQPTRYQSGLRGALLSARSCKAPEQFGGPAHRFAIDPVTGAGRKIIEHDCLHSSAPPTNGCSERRADQSVGPVKNGSASWRERGGQYEKNRG